MYTRFWPKRRPRNAVRGMTTTFAMMYPVLIQVISCTVAPSDPIMCGSATETIDESIAPMSVPNVIDTVTSHLLGLGRTAFKPYSTESLSRDSGPGFCARQGSDEKDEL